MSLKKYGQFIKEDNNETFGETVEKLKEILWGNSYSNMCKTNGDPNTEFNEIQTEMDDFGWTLDRIKKYFETNDFFKEVEKHDLQWVSGEMDIYLYKLAEKLGLDKNKIQLGGGGWADMIHYVDEDINPSEALIRYTYGYHKTHYGKLMLYQAKCTEEEFRLIALPGLMDFITDKFEKTVFKTLLNVSWETYRKNVSYDDLKGDMVVDLDGERITIYVDQIADKLTTHEDNYYEMEIEIEEVVAFFSTIIENLGIEMDVTEKELLLYFEE